MNNLSNTMTDKPQLAVVIIGRNEGERLVQCILAVQAMQIPAALQPYTIIYVDSNSTDGSLERAAKLGAQVLSVKPERPAAAIGRNAGWQATDAPYVLFLDGDTLIHSEFINAAYAEMQSDRKIAVVAGHRRERYPLASIYQRVLDLEWLYPLGDVAFCGGDALMRREALAAVGGYNPQLIAGEEPEMCQRMRAKNYRIVHINHPMTLHDLAIHKFSQWWRRASRTGHAYAEVSQLLKHSDFPLWAAEAKHNFRNTGILLGLLFGSLALSVLLFSLLPFLAFIAFFAVLCLRSGWRARWKSDNLMTLLLYGIHAQCQHFPIALGQVSYYWLRWRGRKRRLIEYK